MSNYQVLFNEKMSELLKDVRFDFGVYSPKFLAEKTAVALKYYTDRSLECTLDEMDKVLQWSGSDATEHPMQIIYIALQACTLLNPNNAGIPVEKWIEDKRVLLALKEQWNKIADQYIQQAAKHAEDTVKYNDRVAAVKKRISLK